MKLPLTSIACDSQDEIRGGKTTHSESTEEVRQPEQRSSGGIRLVYDRATGTWRRAKLPDTSVIYNPQMTNAGAIWAPPTRTPSTEPKSRSWFFGSPAYPRSFGIFGEPQSASQGAGASKDDVFAAAKRRIQEVGQRVRRDRQDLGGFSGYYNW